MFWLFSHGINKGIYLKNLAFFVEFRSTSEPLKTLLPIRPLVRLREVELLRRVELQHFSSLLNHFTALPLHRFTASSLPPCHINVAHRLHKTTTVLLRKSECTFSFKVLRDTRSHSVNVKTLYLCSCAVS